MATPNAEGIKNFNPRSPWGERLLNLSQQGRNIGISIHALREESDKIWKWKKRIKYNFNPRSPWGERPRVGTLEKGVCRFQSTLSVRRATLSYILNLTSDSISIHALREESDVKYYDTMPSFGISIHALREESDFCANDTSNSNSSNFNPRSPWGERPS